MTNKEIAELVMSNPDAWTRGAFYRDSNELVTSRNDEDVCYACASGMLLIVGAPSPPGIHRVVRANDSSKTAKEAAHKIWWLDEKGGAE